MSGQQLILEEIENLPEPMTEEVLDFIRFLKSKVHTEKLSTLHLAESSLKKDWLDEEEDAAWQHL